MSTDISSLTYQAWQSLCSEQRRIKTNTPKTFHLKPSSLLRYIYTNKKQRKMGGNND